MNNTYTNILIAVDGSKEAEKPLKSNSSRKRNNATLTIAHIVDVKAYQKLIAIAERANLFCRRLIRRLQKLRLKLGTQKKLKLY